MIAALRLELQGFNVTAPRLNRNRTSALCLTFTVLNTRFSVSLLKRGPLSIHLMYSTKYLKQEFKKKMK